MGDNSKIEWTDATWNPVVGCKHVHPGCENCYAEQHSARMARMGGKAGQRYAGLTVVGDDGRAKWTGVVREVPDVLNRPLRWRRPRRVFVNSMSDLFHADVSFEHIAAVWAIMAATPRHKYVILTKRPQRAREWFRWFDRDGQRFACGPARSLLRLFNEQAGHALMKDGEIQYVPEGGFPWPLPNVAIGVSVSDQRTADDLIPHLLEIPAAVRIVSAEPLIGPIDLRQSCGGSIAGDVQTSGVGPGSQTWRAGIDQVIIGAESGHRARHCDIRHAQNLAADVLSAGVALFVKQWTVCDQCGGDGHEVDCRYCRGTGNGEKLRKGCPEFYVPRFDTRSWAQMPVGWEL